MSDDAPAPSPGKLFTSAEVAEMLQISTRTLRRLKAEGRLRTVQLGENSPRYEWSAIAALIIASRGGT